MHTIFDTDFQPDDFIIVYEGGEIVYDLSVGDMTNDLKKAYNGYMWYFLDSSLEGAKAIFIG